MNPSTETDARRFLERMLQWDQAPALTTPEVDDLFTLAKVPDLAGAEPDAYTIWKASTAYVLGVTRTPTTRNGFLYIVDIAGTSGATEPSWPTDLDDTVVDGGVTWRCLQTVSWVATYNLPLAAAEGWEWKAAKVAGKYDVKAGSVDATRSQQFDMCKKEAERFRAMAGGTASSGVGWIETTALI